LCGNVEKQLLSGTFRRAEIGVLIMIKLREERGLIASLKKQRRKKDSLFHDYAPMAKITLREDSTNQKSIVRRANID